MRNPNITDNTAQLAIGRVSKSVKKSMTVDEYKSLQNKPKRSKYGNKPTTCTVGDNIIRFASQKEFLRYQELTLMLKANKIVDLRLQPKFTLQEYYVTPDGHKVNPIVYQADFSYRKRINGTFISPELIVEDVKGGNATKTQQYRTKKKLMQEKFNIRITEV